MEFAKWSELHFLFSHFRYNQNKEKDMTKVITSEDCGNSPKNILVQDITTYQVETG